MDKFLVFLRKLVRATLKLASPWRIGYHYQNTNILDVFQSASKILKTSQFTTARSLIANMDLISRVYNVLWRNRALGG